MSAKNASATIRVLKEGAIPNPQSAITIAVDTSYIIAQGGGTVGKGLYMFDNRLTNGSSGEGGLELNSEVNQGDYIGFEVVPIDSNTGDTVKITGFNVSQGSVFGSTGYPMQISASGDYWIGQAVNKTSLTTYQLQIAVSSGGLRPVTYYVMWDPFIGAK